MHIVQYDSLAVGNVFFFSSIDAIQTRVIVDSDIKSVNKIVSFSYSPQVWSGIGMSLSVHLYLHGLILLGCYEYTGFT